MKNIANLTAILLLTASAAHAQEKISPEHAKFFEAKVRPVLVEHCYRCHGDEKQKGHLRVDSRAALLAGGDSGPAVVPNDVGQSLLLKAISHADAELKMPPSKKLAREQIDDFTQWVKLGAPWPGSGNEKVAAIRKGKSISDQDRAHWSFVPVKTPAIPTVENKAWVANPIDAFLLAKLEGKGFQPSPPASKQELCRRLYYDLTGLPPTPVEVDAFVRDTDPQAYPKLVDRLLDSPHYGEKSARHWLDLVRYAETNSYERDNPKPHIWRFRDYVIRSFNADKPFDRFLKEQLAGDELFDGSDYDPLIATGYYRLGIWDDEPTDRLQARYDGLDDILATTAQVFLGLTVDCARCHDHKIDPILQRDYYRLLAFFHNINHFRNGGPTDEFPIVTAENKARFEKATRDFEKKQDELLRGLQEVEAEFRRLMKVQDVQALGTDLRDLSYRFYRDTWKKLPDFDGLKHEDAGKVANNFFDINLRTRDSSFGFVFEGLLVVPEAGKYTFYLDSDDGSRLLVNGKMILEHDGIHGVGNEKSTTIELAAGARPIRLEYFQSGSGLGLNVAWGKAGGPRRWLSAPDRSTKNVDFNRLIAAEGPRVLGVERFAAYKKLQKEFDAIRKNGVPVEKALCVSEAGPKGPETFVLLRGNPQVKGDKVEPGFLTVLNVPDPDIAAVKTGKSSGRRTALANWLTRPENPLTARVYVNRIWQQHFGRGLVRSPNDFGFQGMRPTHPELLDYLAGEFVKNGWKIKDLHRLVLNSNAYRMSSKPKPAALKDDPANDLFWRFDMRRLSAEEIRDSILAVSGNLNLKSFGPPVYPEIPKEVLAGQSKPGYGWPKSSPEDQARRSVYVHVKRSLLLPILESFDVAETDRSTPVRFSSTQPTQALSMLNSDFLNKQAGIFAARLRNEAGADVRDQVQRGLALATSRTPSDVEVDRGLNLIHSLKSVDKMTEERAMQVYCLVLLNLNEFLYLD